MGELLADGVENAAKKLRDNYEDYGITEEDGELAWEAYQRAFPIHGSFEHIPHGSTSPSAPRCPERSGGLVTFHGPFGSRLRTPRRASRGDLRHGGRANGANRFSTPVRRRRWGWWSREM